MTYHCWLPQPKLRHEQLPSHYVCSFASRCCMQWLLKAITCYAMVLSMIGPCLKVVSTHPRHHHLHCCYLVSSFHCGNQSQTSTVCIWQLCHRQPIAIIVGIPPLKTRSWRMFCVIFFIHTLLIFQMKIYGHQSHTKLHLHASSGILQFLSNYV